jgi:hypothetical protein
MTSIKLNQIIAVRKGVQGDSHRQVTELHRKVQKSPLLSGIARTYERLNDEDPELPGESTRVQVLATDVLRELTVHLGRLFDVTAAMDWTNQRANADLVVDDEVLIENCPATYLLFLEKQLVDVETFLRKLPILDPSDMWEFDTTARAYATAPARTTKTAKVMRNHVLAEATDKHPAQVQPYTEDKVIGYWRTVKFSGAVPASLATELLDRVTKLSRAVKFAREAANLTEIIDPKPAAAVFGYLFAPLPR